MKVLVTGAHGWTATAVVQTLKTAGHTVTAFDLPGSAPPFQIRNCFEATIFGDVSQWGDVNQALAGRDAVIHLAVAVGEQDYAGPILSFNTNVRGTYNVFEAARTHRIKRTILVGSAPVHLTFPPGTRIDARTDCPTSPGKDHLYDLTKCLQEVIAKDFCRTYGMTAIVLRAGHLVDGQAGVDPTGRPLSELEYCRGGWLCRYDLAEAVLQALDFAWKGYNAFHVIGSNQARRVFDIKRTEQELGFKCRRGFEAYPGLLSFQD